MSYSDHILILTPVKDAAGHLDTYFKNLFSLTYPHHLLSVAFLEGDSVDGTHELLAPKLQELETTFRRAALYKKDFGYPSPTNYPRYAPHLQLKRRRVLAKSRNHLLFHALDDEDWVLWLDVDVIEYPPDIIERLLATGKDIVQPHCVCEYGGRSFDTNAWRDHGTLHLDDLRPEGEVVPLDSVGGTMLLVRADIHRDGLLFPSFPYGIQNPRIRTDNLWRGEIETEGFAIMAHDLGVQCWGLPNLEIKHHPS